MYISFQRSTFLTFLLNTLYTNKIALLFISHLSVHFVSSPLKTIAVWVMIEV